MTQNASSGQKAAKRKRKLRRELREAAYAATCSADRRSHAEISAEKKQRSKQKKPTAAVPHIRRETADPSKLSKWVKIRNRFFGKPAAGRVA